MGDVAMTVPVLLALVKQHPEVKITVVSRVFFRPFFQNIPNVDFFTAHVHHEHKGLLGLFRLYKDLKAKGITEVADLHNVLRSKVIRTLFAFSGIKTAFVDKGRTEKAALTRSENKIFKQLPTMFERHSIVFKQLGYPIDLKSKEFGSAFLKKQDLDIETIRLIGEFPKPIGTNWIGIAPFAQYDSKVYPLDLMQEVIDKLAENKGYKILLFGGGKKEKELLDSLSKDKENVINIAGKINLKQELQLISNLDVMLSMDSGNAHIAAMYGLKVITLWGATHPFAGFSPFNQPIENALISDRNLFPKIPTSVYGNKKVAGYENAMRTIPVEKIVSKIIEQLD
ncbi:MAG: glycosyltransferase family 9 protein [Flavobacterium sp.]|uniref:glycosyltransferase family 9 protein n=1 Tax=Flavobacterium sp. TaxID=239 RepID=UPI002604315D|nr:glycosyltransferase family 9 protein [Flavobacterium sp.]MDD5149163.1 glycosyltransferase family 9 protein [Flavobacterium sp.]